MRRPLAETLLELAGAAYAFDERGPTLRITSLALDVPIEVRLRKVGDDWEFLGDLPQWRWQTGLEELCGRLCLRWGEGTEP